MSLFNMAGRFFPSRGDGVMTPLSGHYSAALIFDSASETTSKAARLAISHRWN
jgi:hypothetical protein